MKNLIYMLAVSFLFSSCNLNERNKVKSTNQHKSKTIEYDLGEGISTEGAGATAEYIDGKIKKCTIKIYGETGQIKITYQFVKDYINVTQEDFIYKIEDGNINNDKWTTKKISYTLDRNGLLIKSNVDQEKISDIFEEVKKSVPFELE